MKVFAKNIVLAATVLTNNVIAEEVANPFKPEVTEKETFEEGNAETRKLRRAGHGMASLRGKQHGDRHDMISGHVQRSRLNQRAHRQNFRNVIFGIFFGLKAKSPARMLRGSSRELQSDEDEMVGCSGDLGTNGHCNVNCVQHPSTQESCEAYSAGIQHEISTYSYVSTAETGMEGSTCSVNFSIPPEGLTEDEDYAWAAMNEMNRCLSTTRRQLGESERKALLQKRRLSSGTGDSALVKATDAALALYEYGQTARRELGTFGREDEIEHEGTVYSVEIAHYITDAGECWMWIDTISNDCSGFADEVGCTVYGTSGDTCTLQCGTSAGYQIDMLQEHDICVPA